MCFDHVAANVEENMFFNYSTEAISFLSILLPIDSLSIKRHSRYWLAITTELGAIKRKAFSKYLYAFLFQVSQADS